MLGEQGGKTPTQTKKTLWGKFDIFSTNNAPLIPASFDNGKSISPV
jgi:hypothetical protein